ncbi:BEN domain-containing protein 2 [Salminus brasiliensis]|uniref:BEN domain-containing protein 2 n=1 Tax=Salminus brasiliensis TaxID=930266 RepID=UPI003B8371FB
MSAHDNCESQTEITACSFKTEPAGGRTEGETSTEPAAFGRRGSGSPSDSMMSEVEDEALLEDITCVEMENDSPDEAEIVASTEVFGADPLRTLGEILAYCQVMYGAIQKLDEKFEVLQARVTNIQADQSSPKVYSPSSTHSCDVDSSFPNLLQHSPSPPPPVDDTKPTSLLLIPENPTSPTFSANTPPRTVKKMFLKQRRNKPDHPHSNTSGPASKTSAENSGSGKLVLPSSFLRKASTMPRPTSAARFLLRNVFSHEELLHSNTKGDPARGLNKLDPAKISAIREWLQKRYPKHDLSEKGKDWRACVAVMNKGARYIRLMDKKRKPGPITDEQPKPDSPIAPMPTAEIDVELSDSDNDNLQKQKGSKGKFRIEPDRERTSENEDLIDPDEQVYLGSPDRQVKVPQFAIYMAWQRPSAALAARYLIKFIFPEDVLVKSNVYGNAEYGMEPLDHNKISALREHLSERFPELKLEEDGQDWKSCVDAINSSIRKTRHKHKKLRR